MKFFKKNIFVYFNLIIMSVNAELSLGQPSFYYKDGVHTISIPLEPGTNIVSYDLYECEKDGSNFLKHIKTSVIFELERNSIIIDITKIAGDCDKVYDICISNNKFDDGFTNSFVFNKEKNTFEIIERFNKGNFFDNNRQYFRIAMGMGAIACIVYCLL